MEVLRGGRRAIGWALCVAMFVIVTATALVRRGGGLLVPRERDAAIIDALADEARDVVSDDVPRTGVVHAITLEARPVELPLLDGKPLEVWAYNGQVPGPTLRARVGDVLRVTLVNSLPQPTTIHWHGVRVPNAMDGTPGVTQAAVPPGGQFVYEFVLRDAGTFWYHPHVRASEQVERGLHGMLIVEDVGAPSPLRELVWILDDWRLGRHGEIDPAFNTGHDLAHDGRWGQTITVNGIATPAFGIKPGERVRIRLLDVANGRVFIPDFGALEARVVAVDGRYVATPFELKGFEIAPGNRVEIELHAPLEARGRRYDVVDTFSGRPLSLATIVVDDGPAELAAVVSIPTGIVPQWMAALDRTPTAELRLAAERGGPFGIAWTINGEASNHEHGMHNVAFALERGRFARLRFVNDSSRIHPMHLHGVFFKLLARSGRPVDEGFMRDTVLVHAKETVDIGVVPRDEGRWMMHCHILEHAESGMMTLFDVR